MCVEFRLCPDKPVNQIIEFIDQFPDWYLGYLQDEADCEVWELAETLSSKGIETFNFIEPEKYCTLDLFVTEFYADYSAVETLDVGWLSDWRYRALLEEIHSEISDDAITLMSYVINGRPVAPLDRLSSFISCDDASWVSWWTTEEILYLKRVCPPQVTEQLKKPEMFCQQFTKH